MSKSQTPDDAQTIPPVADTTSGTNRGKSKWKQFGLRTLLLLLTLVGLVLAMLTKPLAISRRESAITRQIQDGGGGVTGYESQSHILKPFIPSFLGDKIFRRVADIQFGVQLPSTDLLEDVATLSHVRNLSFAEATDQLVKTLPVIESLESLDLSETSVTDDCLFAIGAQPNLKSVTCLGTQITDRGLRELSQALELETSLVAQRAIQQLMRSAEVVVTVEDTSGTKRESRQFPEPGEKVVGIEFPSMPAADVLHNLKSLTELTSLEVKGLTAQPPREVYVALSELTNLKKLTINNRADIRSSQMVMFADPAVQALPANTQRKLMQQAVDSERDIRAANADNLLPLGSLKNLEELTMAHGYTTSHAYLKTLTNLKTLNPTDFPRESLKYLEKLPNLTTLDIHVLTQVAGEPVSETELIARAKGVEHLTLRSRSLVDEDLLPLAKMTNLKTLSILGSKVKGPGIKYLDELTSLERVEIPTLVPSYQEKLQTLVASRQQDSDPQQQTDQEADTKAVIVAQANPLQLLEDRDATERVQSKANANVKGQRRKLADRDFDVGREWERHAKLANALRGARTWDDAAQSYGTAIKQLTRSIKDAEADGITTDPLDELRQEISKNSYYKALIEFDAMKSPEAAIATLEIAVRPDYSVLPTTTAELADQFTRRATPNAGRSNNNPYWHLAANTRMLAHLYQITDENAKAYETWKRYIMIQRSNGSGQHWVDPIELAKIRSAASKENASAVSPSDPQLFLTVTDKATKFTAKACEHASWQVAADDQPFIGIVPPTGQDFAALAIRLPKGKSIDVWCGGASKSPQKVMLEPRPHNKLEGTFSVKNPFNSDAIFAKITPPLVGNETVLLKAKLRDRETGKPLAWQQSTENTDFTTNPKPFTYTDCWIVDANGDRVRSFSRPTNEWGTSLCRLPNGQLLLAFTSNHIGVSNIEFTTSTDGIHWQEPWSFPHNHSHTTDDQIVLAGDDGTISMVFATFHSALTRRSVWGTSSKDGREWSKPILLKYPRFHMLPLDFLRRPGGDYLIVTNHGVGYGPNALAIREFEKIELPTRTTIAGPPRMTFDDNDLCHAVGAIGNDIFYTTSKDLEIWSPAKLVAKSTQKGLKVKPRLFIDGDRAALIYRSNEVATIKLGEITSDGIKFSDKEFASESAWLDPEMLKTDDGWISIIDASNRKLMILKKDDLFSLSL